VKKTALFSFFPSFLIHVKKIKKNENVLKKTKRCFLATYWPKAHPLPYKNGRDLGSQISGKNNRTSAQVICGLLNHLPFCGS